MIKKLLCLLTCLLLSTSLSAEERKVALLFLTRSDLNQTEVWKNWIDPNLYIVYNHPKSPPEDPWFSQFEIGENQPTKWGYLLLAQKALLKEALKDASNFKFVFLSESCIPLRTSDEVYQALVSHEKSHMRWGEIWWKNDPRRILKEFPRKHHLGNHQWIILNRKHAQMIADDDKWIHKAMKHICCDEAYPSTFFSMRGVLNEFVNELTTFVDWTRGGPYVFTEDSDENLAILFDAKSNPQGPYEPRNCLFARKFSKEFPSNTIETLIMTDPLGVLP